MGKHAKPKVKGGRHAKPSVSPVKKVAAIGATAAAVPVAALAFSNPASAATMSAWDATSIPEAGGDWCIDHSSDGLSVGGLQFQNPSWHDALAYLNSHGHDTSQWQQNLTQFMGRSNVPSKDQQVLAGEALLHLQGPGAWANGNFQGGSSMFDGGANPWGLSGTSAPAGIEAHASCTGSTPTPPGPVTPPADGTYVVKAGDTLSSIAAQFGIVGDGTPDGGWKQLAAWNPQIANPDVIEIGDVINVVAPSTPGPDPTPVPTPTPTPGHHWKHHHHHWHHKPVPTPPSPVTPPVDPSAPVAPASCDHIVVHGDTVSAVAAEVGAPLAAVEAVNPGIVTPPRPGDYSLIFAGGHIHMPAGFCATGE